jgi:hypothetical protein
MNEFYVYIHLNPTTNEVFHIGKGKGNRANSKSSRNKYWKEYVSKIGNNFKSIIVKNNLSETEALELEKKIIQKFDWHYTDQTTNIEESFPDLNVKDLITIQFTLGEKEIKNGNSQKSSQFQNYTDSEIIASLLTFPNETNLKEIEKGFRSIYNEFYENYDELDEIDSDLNYEIEISIESINDLFQEYKVSDKENITELISDLKREKFDIELLLEQKPESLQKNIIEELHNWVVGQITAGNNGSPQITGS